MVKPGRDLNFLERYNVSQSSLGLYANFAISAQYNHDISPELLSNGLKVLIERNSVLSLTIRQTKPGDEKYGYLNYRCEPVDLIKFEDVVTLLDRPFGPQELNYINEQHCGPNQGMPIWRVILYSNNYITMYTDHTLFDGESGKGFHKELNEIFQELSGQEPLELQSELFNYNLDQYTFKMPPKINEICDIYNVGGLEQIKLVLKEVMPGPIRRFYHHLFDSKYPQYFKYPFFVSKNRKSPTTYFDVIHIEDSRLKELLQYVRRRGLTLTPFLDVVLNYCLQKTLLAALCPGPVSTKTNIVLSGRRLYPDLAKQVKYQNMWAACMPDLDPITDLNEEFLIRELKRIGTQIENTFKNRNGFKYIGLLKFVNPYKHTNVKQPYWNQDILFEISNLGYNDFRAGDWHIKDLVFNQSIGYSCTFGCSTISSPNGLKIAFSHLGDKRFQTLPIGQFIDMFHSVIGDIIQEGSDVTKSNSM